MIALFALLLVAAPAARAAGPGQSCSGSATVSALNQYCESIPGAAGAHTPGPGTISVARSLPRSLSRRLDRSGPIGHKLLRVPAGAPRLRLGRATGADPWGLSMPLALVLAGMALALAAAAAARRRRPPHPA